MRSVSASVAPIFEKEVNKHLDDFFPLSLPGCRCSDFRVREVEDESTGDLLLEIDTFGYMFEDSLEKGKDTSTSGIYVVAPSSCSGKKSEPTPSQKLSGSPGAKERNVELEAEKYVIGETYSGQSNAKVRDKLRELEIKIKKMVSRHDEKHASTCGDVTSLVGAAILAFSNGSKSRSAAATEYLLRISSLLNKASTPYLWRLAQAHRFFLVVLSAHESPVASALREVAAGQQASEASQLAIESRLQSIQETLESLKI